MASGGEVADRSSARGPKPAVKADVVAHADSSFDQWLDLRLKCMYDSVLKEPLPEEILKLLEQPKLR